MRILASVLAGMILGVACTYWRRPVAVMLTRIPPATPPDHRPRYRTWQHGQEIISASEG